MHTQQSRKPCNRFYRFSSKVGDYGVWIRISDISAYVSTGENATNIYTSSGHTHLVKDTIHLVQEKIKSYYDNETPAE